MNKIITPIIIAVFAAVALLIGIAVGRQMSTPTYPAMEQEAVQVRSYGGQSGKFSKINAILSLIDQAYVEDIDVDNLTDDILPDIMHNLDPHSAYVPASEVEESHEDLEGSFSGIGVQFNIQNDTVMVVDVIAGVWALYLIRPAKRAEIHAIWDEKWSVSKAEYQSKHYQDI